MRIPDREFRLQILKRVGAKLTELRGDLSQSELAKQARVTRASISALEGGQQGISVVEQPQLSKAGYASISGLLLRREGSTICIINRDHPPTRRRYSIAHEIGHFILHPPEEAYIDVAARSDKSSDGTDPREIEAN